MYIIIIIKSTSASIISLKYMPKWKKVLNVSSLMSNKYARFELIQYKIYAIRTKYYLLFDLSDISEILKFGHSHQNWHESAKLICNLCEKVIGFAWTLSWIDQRDEN